VNRFLQYCNLVGVVALAALCVVQWRANRQAWLQVGGLEQTRLEQAAKLAEQDKALKGCAADLDNFRDQLSRVHGALKETEAGLAVSERRSRQLTSECDQLKTSLTNWVAAVSAREEQLKKANEQVQKLADARNETVVKFNELAEKYNALTKDPRLQNQ
jgi:uncharacterized coiled-coil DUF342 family protein